MSEKEEGTTTVEDFIDSNEDFSFDLMEPTMSETIGKIAGALAKAQGEMGGVKKTSTNPFYKSKYADINDCLEAALPALSKNGLAISQGNKFSEVSGYFITTTLI